MSLFGHKIGNLKYDFNISYLPSTRIKKAYYLVETWCLIKFSMLPVPAFPHLFHLSTEPQRWKEALLHICEALRSMHRGPPQLLIPVQNGLGGRPRCAGCISSVSSHSPRSIHPIARKMVLFWWVGENLQTQHTWGVAFRYCFNRPPDGHIKAKGLL